MSNIALRDKYSFVISTVVRRDIIYVAAVDDAVDYATIPHGHIFFSHAGQVGNLGMVDWGIIGLTLVSQPERRILAVGSMGQAVSIGQGQRLPEQVGTPAGGPQDRGMIRCVSAIDGFAYAAGMNRQVYRRIGAGIWDAIDYEPSSTDSHICGFESVDGFAIDDVYAAGWHGEIAHYGVRGWQHMGSPTNLILTGTCCAGDGSVYFCGQSGTILAGRENLWRIIRHEATKEDFWSIVWFRDAIYVSTMHFIYRLVHDRLERIDMGPDYPQTCYHLCTDGDILLSTGRKDVLAFDGADWRRIF